MASREFLGSAMKRLIPLGSGYLDWCLKLDSKQWKVSVCLAALVTMEASRIMKMPMLHILLCVFDQCPHASNPELGEQQHHRRVRHAYARLEAVGDRVVLWSASNHFGADRPVDVRSELRSDGRTTGAMQKACDLYQDVAYSSVMSNGRSV
jgi:hypothetical protein